jgi:hypothetical protein
MRIGWGTNSNETLVAGPGESEPAPTEGLDRKRFLEVDAVGMRSRRARSVGLATVASLALGLLVAAPATAAIEVEPTLQHNDPISSLASPEYGRSDAAAALDKRAAEDRDAITQRAAQDSSDGEEVDKFEKDCAKAALGALGWDIWWAVSEGQSFDLRSTAQQAIEQCLKLYIPGQVDAHTTARNFAAIITSDAEAVYQQEQGDIYGVADWMLYADYWYIAE